MKKIKQFLKWYREGDGATIAPVPSNKMLFWAGVIIFSAIVIKVLQEHNLI